MLAGWYLLQPALAAEPFLGGKDGIANSLEVVDVGGRPRECYPEDVRLARLARLEQCGVDAIGDHVNLVVELAIDRGQLRRADRDRGGPPDGLVDVRPTGPGLPYVAVKFSCPRSS